MQVSEIPAALVRLWDALEGTNKMRASLFNLLIVAPKNQRTDYVRTITLKVLERFPSRVIFTTIDKTFGSSGIGMDEHQVELLKKTYLYLIFLTKLEKINTNILFQQYQPAFMAFLQNTKSTLPYMPTVALVTSSVWQSVTITAQDIQNSKMWQLYTQLMIADMALIKPQSFI